MLNIELYNWIYIVYFEYIRVYILKCICLGGFLMCMFSIFCVFRMGKEVVLFVFVLFIKVIMWVGDWLFL